MSTSLRLPRAFRSAPQLVAAAFVVLAVAAAVVVTLLLVRTPSAAAPAPSHSLQTVDDGCYEAGPATPC
jgi:hypothetical protein